MLTENDVIEAITTYLREQGYTIQQQLTTDVRGIDVIASSEAATWFVEAKGATSSKEHTARFGKPFNTNQVNSHVSRAVFTAMKIRGLEPAGERTRVAVGLPANRGHRQMVENIEAALDDLGIARFWVNDDRRVTLDDPRRF